MKNIAVALVALAACGGGDKGRTEKYQLKGWDTTKPEISVTVTFPKDWHESLDHMAGESVELTPPDAVPVMGALHIEVQDCKATPPSATACLDEAAPENRGFSAGHPGGEIKHEDLGPGRRFMSWTGTVKDHKQGEVRLAIYDEQTQQVVSCDALLMDDKMYSNFDQAPAFRKVCETVKIAR